MRLSSFAPRPAFFLRRSFRIPRAVTFRDDSQPRRRNQSVDVHRRLERRVVVRGVHQVRDVLERHVLVAVPSSSEESTSSGSASSWDIAGSSSISSSTRPPPSAPARRALGIRRAPSAPRAGAFGAPPRWNEHHAAEHEVVAVLAASPRGRLVSAERLVPATTRPRPGTARAARPAIARIMLSKTAAGTNPGGAPGKRASAGAGLLRPVRLSLPLPPRPTPAPARPPGRRARAEHRLAAHRAGRVAVHPVLCTRVEQVFAVQRAQRLSGRDDVGANRHVVSFAPTFFVDVSRDGARHRRQPAGGHHGPAADALAGQPPRSRAAPRRRAGTRRAARTRPASARLRAHHLVQDVGGHV